jgi:spermidine synthase
VASLPAVVLLFGPPTYLLGYVSPYAAQLSVQEEVGEASGHVYAVGTVGSIVGAFATTYLLVPELGIDAIALVFGLLSVGTAVALLDWTRVRDRERLVGGFVLAVLMVVATGAGAAGVTLSGETVYETQTPYQELRVADDDGVRTLYLDGQRHSAMDLSSPTRHVFDYTRHFHLPFLMRPPGSVERVLFVGGGGFSGPRRFLETYPNVTVDVVEIDPEVVSVAERYFGVNRSHPRLNVHVGDGRAYLRETDHEYDAVVLDAYRKDKAPFHLTTVEFVRLTERRLDADGVVVMNVISAPSGPASRFYRAEHRTVSRVFPRVYGFQTANGSVVQNVVLVATKEDRLLTERELLDRDRNRRIGIGLAEEIRGYRRDEPTDDVPVLTDDRAPVDALLDPLVGQRYEVQTTAPDVADSNRTTTAASGRSRTAS